MAVKLIVVALLAAAVVSAANTEKEVENAKDVAVFKECSNDDCSTCDDAKTKQYTLGECKQDGDKYYKVRSCPTGTADPIIVEGFAEPGCTPRKETVTRTCTATIYDKASCTDNAVTLFTGCAAGCDGDCSKTVQFSGEQCHEWKGMFLKLKAGVDCSSDSFVFTKHQSCTAEGGAGEAVADNSEYTAAKVCTGTGGYRMYKCAETLDIPGVLLNANCPDDTCGSNGNCEGTMFKMNDYTEYSNEQWYVDTCPENNIEFSVYASVAKHPKACAAAGGVYKTATCGPIVETIATTTTTDTTTATDTTTTATDTTTATGTTAIATTATGITATGTTTATTIGDSDTTDDNNTNTDNAANSPLLSVTVLALVACLLACVY